MRKIGILFGQENTFPWAFIDRVNEKIKEQGIKDMVAEAVSIDTVEQAKSDEYAVIIDRISQDVPFYRAYLKNAAITGTAVINNPFWWSADEKFFNNALAESIGVPVPKTFILPSSHRPADTDENSFRNMKFPFDWEKMFNTIGFPAYMKPHDGGGWKSVYRVESPEDLWAKHGETENLVMMLQEEINFTEYFRCYALGTDQIHIMQYEPRNPHHLRYVIDGPPVDKKLLDLVEEYCIKLNRALGYDFNTVEFAVRDGIPYAIDFCNPAPDADINSVGQENFDWIVENAADMAIAKAKKYKKGQMNLTWGSFVKDQIETPKAPKKTAPVKKAVKKAPVKKTAAKKATKTNTKAKKASPKAVVSETATAPKPVVKKVAPKKKTATKVAKKKAPAKKAATKTKTAKK
ncbi:glutathione synthase/RimK-type ligase-like ATP-grasp enzyme [Winogradskyella eximia]|uniref:Glutathione synthase/RimK-type ligase-like ATP-grasp enzyme n=1 Tax=Winogradskyella eximia TaxID=262006 RepID=A0A3D9H7C2_9FLAO|nr:glutathione synthase/RimK-type ligase-like ATP-grasp enzyme [Winogradskyella eximia]